MNENFDKNSEISAFSIINKANENANRKIEEEIPESFIDYDVQEKSSSNIDFNVEDENVDNFRVKSITHAIPLEPCVLFVLLDSEEDLGIGSYGTKGIPGFLDAENEKFYLLDGSLPHIPNFQDKVKDFIRKSRE